VERCGPASARWVKVDATKAGSGAGTSVGNQNGVSHDGRRQVSGASGNNEARNDDSAANRCGAQQEPPCGAKKQHWVSNVAAETPKPQTNNPKNSNRRRRRRGRRGHRNSDFSGPTYGALDLGTNNCRLLVARPTHSGFRVIDAFSRIVRLGEGVSKTGRLSPEAMDRCISALQVCASKLKWRSVKRSRLIATEACRIAENGPEFIDRVVRETGLELEIINPETEARLAFSGSAALIEPDCDHALVFDIGGGSTELMWIKVTNGSHELVEWVSLPAGVVTVAEGFGGIEVTPESYAAMKNYALPLLEEFAGRVANRVGANVVPDHLLGTSGTVTTIAGVHLGLRRYDRSKVDGCWMNIDEVSAVTQTLVGMSYEDRAASPCIGRERADLVLAGCAIFDAIKDLWPAPRIRVADRGLREGILTMLMQEDGTYGNPRGKLRGSK
jgi:exopolyphosphatase/guanosine-5'-triphosphate,3'-diphosphate pyrophosphatase